MKVLFPVVGSECPRRMPALVVAQDELRAPVRTASFAEQESASLVVVESPGRGMLANGRPCSARIGVPARCEPHSLILH